MNIGIIGCGYVGLVSGACLSRCNKVTCCDVDTSKIKDLQNKIVSIQEPGLENLVSKGIDSDNLRFTTDLNDVINASDILFVCVGTPSDKNGNPNLDALLSVVETIKTYAKSKKIIVLKSTVPIGTNAKVSQLLPDHTIVNCPEFLQESRAVQDFLNPSRIVVGTQNLEVANILQDLFEPFLRDDEKFLVMPPDDAELVKYAANAFLATKISFINEIALLCASKGISIDNIRQGIGYDPRIGFEFLQPGPGFAGSCLVKDLLGLISFYKEEEVSPMLLKAVHYRNEIQRMWAYKQLIVRYPNLDGKKICLWGLAFKANTNDTRESAALMLVDRLWDKTTLRVYDPVVDTKSILGNKVFHYNDPYDAVRGCDALLILTEWREFRNIDLLRVKELMNTPLIIDSRNLYKPETMKDWDFEYISIGRP